MDSSLNESTSRNSPSFSQTINNLFYTGHGPKPSTLSQLSSKCIRKMTTHSCHISFLKTCRDHDLIPRGLRLKDPIGNSHSESTLHDASLSLLKQRLNHYRTAFIQQQQLLKTTMDKLQQILTDNLCNKLLEMHKRTASVLFNSLLTKHDKKFSSLLLEFNLPFLSPYSLLQSFNLNIPTISGPLKSTTPLIKPDDSRRTVINLTDTQLTMPQTELLSLGLKFSPTEVMPKISTLASKIESSTRTLSPAVENAIVNDINNIFQRPSITKPNLKPHLSAALKSLQRQKNTLKITRADKRNATVIMTQKQYNDKILEHLDLDCYTLLNKDPTDSLNRKLDSVLKKLLKEKKIDKPFFDSCRTSNPRRPQLYGLPKIHKPGNPIRPIVSFYNTPLSSLHKQLSIILKPLTISPLRLKDSCDFVKYLNSSSDPNYSYYCSLDVKSLYTSCDMRLAAKIVLDKLQEDPTILPDNITVDAVYTLLNFSLDNSYFQYNDQFYKQTTGGPMGSPLTVALAEIRATETEQLALETSSQPPKHYRHFVDDGFGHFMNQQHAKEFLRHINGLTNDLQYTIEHPTPDGAGWGPII